MGCKGKTVKETETKPDPFPTEVTSVTSGSEKEQILREVALAGNLAEVQKILSEKIDVDTPDQDGRTAIMLAGYNGHTDVADLIKSFQK